MTNRYKFLHNYEIAGCAAFDKNLISIWGQQWPNNDPLEPRPTSAFFYYFDEPDPDRWAGSGIANATGIHGCAGVLPTRQWIFVLDDGEVYVVGGGHDDFEKRIVPEREAFFSNVRCIRSGEVLAVGGRRKVYLRERADKWSAWGSGLATKGSAFDMADAGFSDIDGFDLGELYACGGHGDLWMCRHSIWEQIDLRTDQMLSHICCAPDGFVYVTTLKGGVYKGRHQRWKFLPLDMTNRILESIVSFNNRVLVSTDHEILEIAGSRLVPALLPGMPPLVSYAHLAAGQDILVVAGKDEAALFDGSSWVHFLTPDDK